MVRYHPPLILCSGKRRQAGRGPIQPGPRSIRGCDTARSREPARADYSDPPHSIIRSRAHGYSPGYSLRGHARSLIKLISNLYNVESIDLTEPRSSCRKLPASCRFLGNFLLRGIHSTRSREARLSETTSIELPLSFLSQIRAVNTYVYILAQNCRRDI